MAAAPGRLEAAARAAYTRPDSTLPWERRKPARQAYWRDVGTRAVVAAIPLHVLADVAARHMPVPRPDSHAMDCTGCGYVAEDATDHGTHVGLAIHAAVFGWDEAEVPARAGDERERRRLFVELDCLRCGSDGRAVDAVDAPDDIPPAGREEWAQDQDDAGETVCGLCGHRWRTP